MPKYTVRVAGKDKDALRQSGHFTVHPDECECRKCKRARKAKAHRAKPRYGQQP